MTKYRMRVAAQDGRPHVETIEVDSIEHALNYAKTHDLEVDAIEAIETRRRFEPEGPIPPTAPRQVPAGANNLSDILLVFVGVMFMVIPLVFFAVGTGLLVSGEIIGLFLILFPMLHFSVGVGSVWRGVRTMGRRRYVYTHGIPASATVDRSGPNKMRVNGRLQHKVEWTFYVHDRPYHGKHASTADGGLDLVEGDQIWVLYDPEDPSRSVEWPPF